MPNATPPIISWVGEGITNDDVVTVVVVVTGSILLMCVFGFFVDLKN
jgi:hypothetical protein